MKLKTINPQVLFTRFFEKNLFERIIIYAFLSYFFVKLIFELFLGQWSFVQSQNQQWIFYGLLGLDYLLSYKKILNLKITVNPMSLFSLFCFVLVGHGLLVGIAMHNQPFIILNDTVPILMMGLNILRMQSESEEREIDFSFLCKICIFLAAGSCFFGFLAQSMGKPSQPSMGDAKLFLPLFTAAIIMIRPHPKTLSILTLLILVICINDLNRTSLLFLATILPVFLLNKIIKNPFLGFQFLFMIFLVGVVVIMMVPENSKTYARVANIQNIDFSERKGSVGERQAEWDAIQTKLASHGKTIEWLGLGFGSQYEVKFTHQYMKDYGHAHFSWAWFNLRFGKIGYVYLFILFSALIFNGIRSFFTFTEIGVFVGFLCLIGIFYLGTYVNAVLLLNGLHFFYIKKKHKNEDYLLTC